MVSGCDSGGLKEGVPADAPKEGMTIDHKSFMEKNSAKMQMSKGKPKEAPAAPKETPKS